MNEQQINYCDWRRIPHDLWPRILKVLEREELGPRRTPPPYLGTAIYLGRGLQGRAVTVYNTPTLIQRSQYAWPYMILNPSKTAGITSWGLLHAGTVNAAGQSGSIGVSNYENLHLLLNVSAVTGTWDIVGQIYNPYTSSWADSQTIFSAINSAGDYYGYIGSLGVATDFRIRWDPVAAGSITFSVTRVLKGGLVGTSAGFSQTVYLGNNEVNVDTGFPILEGQHYVFVIGENVDLYGVCEDPSGVTIRVFEL